MSERPHDTENGPTDSAGQPWAGRQFAANPAADDDGAAPPALVEGLRAFRAGEISASALIDVVRDCRFLIPLVAAAGEEGENEHGVRIDKTQELSIISVAGPDGRPILPVFSSVAAMAQWRADARPVPASAQRVALAAASEQIDRVVIDARGDELVLPRAAVWAIARGTSWVPALADAAVIEAIARPAEESAEILAVAPVPGDPELRGTGPEVVVRIAVAPSADSGRLREVIALMSASWAADPLIAERVDAISIQPVLLTTEQL
jgi:hypothetical protein